MVVIAEVLGRLGLQGVTAGGNSQEKLKMLEGDVREVVLVIKDGGFVTAGFFFWASKEVVMFEP